MNEQAGFSLRGRNPDVLTCIANLSNDEVFTPPDLAGRMLDTLAKAWAAGHDAADMNTHGGKRKGAGRKAKWTFEDELSIGGECEKRWLEASRDAIEGKLDQMETINSDLRAVYDAVNKIPLSKRQEWHGSDCQERHLADITAELAALSGKPDDEDPPRIYSVSKKPPRGTTKQIIKDVADKFNLSRSVVKNLWAAFRRFKNEDP